MEMRWITGMSGALCGVLLAMPGLLTVADATAAELRKCVLAGGAHAYVSDAACPAGSREQWQRSVAADPGQDDDLKRRRQEIADWQASNRQTAARMRLTGMRTVRSAGPRTANTGDQRCERARQRRDRSRDREWMHMTYERMLRLDQDVADACR